MSLLMDALKKAEHIKQESEAELSQQAEQELHQPKSEPDNEALTLEIELPAETEQVTIKHVDDPPVPEEATLPTSDGADLPELKLEIEDASDEIVSVKIEPAVKPNGRIKPPELEQPRLYSPVVKRHTSKRLIMPLLLGTVVLGLAAGYLYFEQWLESSQGELFVMPSSVVQRSADLNTDSMMEATETEVITEEQQPLPLSPKSEPIASEEVKPEKLESLQSRVEASKLPAKAIAKPTPPPVPKQVPVKEVRAKVPVQVTRTLRKDTLQMVLEKGYAAYQRGDAAAASRHYLQAQKRAPKSRDALLGLAAVNQQQGNLPQAHHYYQQLLKINPKDSQAITGILSLQSGAVQSESQIKLLLEQEPNAAHLHFALGGQYVAQSRWGEAQQAFFEAFHIDPQNPDYIYNLAVSLDHLAKRKMALVYYRRALEQAPGKSVGFDFDGLKVRISQLTAAGEER